MENGMEKDISFLLIADCLLLIVSLQSACFGIIGMFIITRFRQAILFISFRERYETFNGKSQRERKISKQKIK